ncbi:phage tail fiber protein [Microvirga antarctica]|uniref:phage tail fiber protein n=1 Tax=Microvirga antarctica TaxID=2819233 RepID=UPI001B318732|nr:hypothetical protein [Microvirga antarctica]
MGSLTNYTEKKLLDHLLGKAAFPLPAGLYLGLFKADPTEAGSLASEVTGGSYARVDVRSIMTVSDATTGQSVNASAIAFAAPTAAWGTITHVGFLDAATGGTLLACAPLSIARVVNAGDPPSRFLQGQLSIRLD